MYTYIFISTSYFYANNWTVDVSPWNGTDKLLFLLVPQDILFLYLLSILCSFSNPKIGGGKIVRNFTKKYSLS